MGTPRGQENLTPEGREVVAKIDQVLESLEQLRKERSSDNATVTERFEKLDERFGKIDERFEKVDERFEKIDKRFETMERHLGYLKGSHAASAMRRNAILVAHDMGYQLVTQMPREMVVSFANMARAANKPLDDVRSFENADLVLLANDDEGNPIYIAVEASFTIAMSDIKRAKRNAEYLEQFTGLPSKGAVAGVEIESGKLRNARVEGVHWYEIPVKYLEAD